MYIIYNVADSGEVRTNWNNHKALNTNSPGFALQC